MDVLEAIKTRRSVRQYKKDPVPQDLLQQVLEAGRLSPSGSNSQPWDFIVFTEPGLRKQVAHCFMYGSFLTQSPVGIAIVVDVWRGGTAVQDGTLAAYSMMLAAHALGLGTCWINPGYRDDAARELLKIPEGKEILCVLSLGYPAGRSPATPRRRLSDIVHMEEYGNRAVVKGEE